jgi:glucokinase
VVGIDVGGTKIAAGVVDTSGNVVSHFYTRAHAGQPPADVIKSIEEAFYGALRAAGVARGDIMGVGVGFAGHVNGPAGLVLTSSNLPEWDNVPLRQIIADRIGKPVRLDNDANCAALAEYRFGAGRGSRHMCYVTFSTGYGLGIIINGNLYVGATGTAGEIGHTVVDPDGPLCSCGKRGCIMAYACGMALSRMAYERIHAGEETILRDLCGGAPESISGETVAAAARQGDRLARELIEIAGRYFGIGLSTIVQVLNPEVIVIGGGLARIGSMLMEPCLQALRENVHPVIAESARIVYSQLWDDAGLIGAGALLWEG